MKYKFLIMGDSWGIGEWKKEFVKGEKPDPILRHGRSWEWTKSWRNDNEWCLVTILPNTDIGTHLRNKGHTVQNIAEGGDANFRQLLSCRKELEKNSNYDYIVWFHTEPIRDYLLNLIQLPDSLLENLKEYDGYDKLIEHWFKETYQQYEEIYQQYKIPFFVIGGMTPLPDYINNFNFVKHKIVNWSKEYIFENSPEHPLNAGQFYNFVEKHIISMDLKRIDIETEKIKKWTSYCAMHKHFPDWGHPDNECHQKLAEIILKEIDSI